MSTEHATMDYLALYQGALAARIVDSTCEALKVKWSASQRFEAEREAAMRWLAGEDKMFAPRCQQRAFGGMPIVLVG